MTTIDEVADRVGSETERNRKLAVWIGFVAVWLSIASWGGGNAQLDVNQSQLLATNAWAFYQAKNIRRNDLSVAVDQMRFNLMAHDTTEAQRKEGISLMQGWHAYADQLFDEKSTGEGMQQLAIAARMHEKERTKAQKADSAFGLANVALQSSIVFASLAILVGLTSVIWLSGAAGAVGIAFAVFGLMQ